MEDTPFPPTPRLPFKIERIRSGRREDSDKFIFSSWTKMLLLLESRKTPVRKQPDFQPVPREDHSEDPQGGQWRGTKQINPWTLMPLGTYTNYCHYKLHIPFEYWRKGLGLKEKVRLFFKPLVTEVSIIILIIILALQMIKLNHGAVRIHPRPCTELQFRNVFWALVVLSDR